MKNTPIQVAIALSLISSAFAFESHFDPVISACLLYLIVVILTELSRHPLWARRVHSDIQWLQWLIESCGHTFGVDHYCSLLFKHDLLALLYGIAAHRQIRSGVNRWLDFTCDFYLLHPSHAPIWSCCSWYFVFPISNRNDQPNSCSKEFTNTKAVRWLLIKAENVVDRNSSGKNEFRWGKCKAKIAVIWFVSSSQK